MWGLSCACTSVPQCELDGTNCVIPNWGGNVSFRVAEVRRPRTEAELRAVLNASVGRCVRVAGTLHSFNASCATPQVLLRMDEFRKLELEPDASGIRVGAGVLVGDVVTFLHNCRLMLPVPLSTTYQNLVGCLAHGTRGCGSQDLASCVKELRITSRVDGQARTQLIKDPEQLRHCCLSLGLMGVVSEVFLDVVPEFLIREEVSFVDSYELAHGSLRTAPLSQVTIVPYTWKVLVLHREHVDLTEDCIVPRHAAATHIADFGRVRSMADFAGGSCSLEVLGHVFHTLSKAAAARVSLDRASEIVEDVVTWMPCSLHFEVAMPLDRARTAVELLRVTVEIFAGTEQFTGESPISKELKKKGLWDRLMAFFGTAVFNIACHIRVAHPDTSLVSPTYLAPPDPTPGKPKWCACVCVEYYTPSHVAEFEILTSVLLTLWMEFCDARLHWGKYFPLDDALLEANRRRHPGLEEFLVRRGTMDPEGQFINDHYKRVLGMGGDGWLGGSKKLQLQLPAASGNKRRTEAQLSRSEFLRMAGEETDPEDFPDEQL